MKDLNYPEVYKEWGNSRYKSVFYKDKQLFIMLVRRLPVWIPFGEKTPGKAFYVGKFKYTPIGEFCSKRTSFESIHYDKVVSRFQRFVDEYCTDWQARASYLYKGYDVRINKERDKEFYIGYVHFHKNSIYKYIANTREEVEVNCKNRIDRVIKEKERVQMNPLSTKQEKIQELEQLQAKISAQLEELKKEKDTLTYKGMVLEILPDIVLSKGVLRGIDNPSPFVEGNMENLKKSFEKYVDKLETQYHLYRKLTGKEG